MNSKHLIPFICTTVVSFSTITGCSKQKEQSSPGRSYSFTATASTSIALKGSALLELPTSNLSSTGPTLCSSVVCFTPTVLTGKYYGAGLLIQSNGNGMNAYFGRQTWSEITGSSEALEFSSAMPLVNTGNLVCCTSTGDLSNNSSYVSDVMYLFAYLDATFVVSGVTSNIYMNREFTVRFVFADGAITGGKRGDLLLKDPADGVFKWMDTDSHAGGNVGDGTLVTTRPTNPVTMDSAVTNWTNPFGSDKGNQSIPVIYAGVLPESGSGVFSVTESVLSTNGKTYTFSFDPTNFVMFPTAQISDINMLYSYKQLLSKIHLGGLPHSAQTRGVGSPASTVLTVTSGG